MNPVDGILIIDKPAGMTSHDVVARVRKIIGTRRVGHTGTLDPFATGVLVLVVGKATRLARFLDKDVKEYVADVHFGFETDTGDLTGSRISDCGLRVEELEQKLASVSWTDILDNFRGDIMQTPPMYSAKKIDGKKLYEHARKGEEVAREPVRVTIHELEILPDELGTPHSTLRIKVACSAGTYIRTLAVDIGRSIGIGAHLTALRRTAAGRFDLSNAVTLDDLERSSEPSSLLRPLEESVSHLAEFKLPDERVDATRNGLGTGIDESIYDDGEHVRMTNGDDELVAVGIYGEAERSIRPKVVLI